MALVTDRFIEFEVTQADINNGNRGDSYWCPIAVAVRRVVKDYSVVAGWLEIGVRWGETRKVTKTYSVRSYIYYAHAYRQWIINYDAGLSVQPFKGVMERVVR